MWVEKYRPTELSGMVGNEQARLAVVEWLKKWKPGSKPVLLLGPPGTGKTTLVTLLAKQRLMNLIDLNASDTRTKDRLEKRIGEATKTVSLFGERSLVFLDEVDGLLGRSDYGGVEFIKGVVKETQNPIIMAANDPDADEIRKLSSSCITLEFKPPPPREVEMYLRMIADDEGLEFSGGALQELVRTSEGDIRHAINSLQAGAASVTRASAADLAKKDSNGSVAQSLNAFFDSSDPAEALEALRRVNLPPMDKLREIFRSATRSNLPPAKLAAALEVLSRMDVMIGQMLQTGEWRLLRYLDGILAQELHPVLKGERVRYLSEDLPFPMLLRIWNDSKKIREISLKYAKRMHTSGSGARVQDLPFVFAMCSKKDFRTRLEEAIGLDDTYDKFLQKESGR